MAKVFLDANILIDLIEKRGTVTPKNLDNQDIYISPLSVHILMYITRHKVPYEVLSLSINSFTHVPFDETIAELALLGPTADFEDNVQLHSAAEAECDIFLTEDKKLLDMKFFGKVKIISRFSP